jgi:dTDP-4-dehydrorhamnose 3,5-epimerase
MIFHETKIPGAYIIDLEKRVDERGYFARTWCRKEFEDAGLTVEFVQANVSTNPQAGTLRGLHYQKVPFSEAKLVQCVRGTIYDVIVDLRPGSKTFRQWLGVELTAESRRMLFVPEEFAHGYQTLQADSEVSYLVSHVYVPNAGAGVRYDDPALGITWPRPVTRISAQDTSWPALEGRDSPAAGERRVSSAVN